MTTVAKSSPIPPIATEAWCCRAWRRNRTSVRWQILAGRVRAYRVGRTVLIYTSDLVELWGNPKTVGGYHVY